MEINYLPDSGELSADSICKQFEPRSGPTKFWVLSGSRLFDALVVVLSSYHASGDFCRLLITFANSLAPGQGAQWLSGKVLDSRPRGRGFEPHQRHCVVVLEQDTFILA